MARKIIVPTSQGAKVYRPDLPGGVDPGLPLPDLGDTENPDLRVYVAARVTLDNKRLALARSFATASGSQVLVTADLENRTFDQGWPTLAQNASDIAWSPDGQHIAIGHLSGTGGGMRVFDLATKEVVTSPLGLSQAVPAVGYSPDGQFLAAHHANSARFSMWTPPGYEATTAPAVTSFTANGLDWSDDGAYIAISSNTGARLVNVATRTVETITGIALSGFTPVRWRPGTHEFVIGGWHAGRARAEFALVNADTKEVTFHWYGREESGWNAELSWAANMVAWVNETDLALVGIRNSEYLMLGVWRAGEGYSDVVNEHCPTNTENPRFIATGRQMAVFDDPTDPADPEPPPGPTPIVERTRHAVTTDDIPDWSNQPVGSTLVVDADGALTWQTPEE